MPIPTPAFDYPRVIGEMLDAIIFPFRITESKIWIEHNIDLREVAVEVRFKNFPSLNYRIKQDREFLDARSEQEICEWAAKPLQKTLRILQSLPHDIPETIELGEN